VALLTLDRLNVAYPQYNQGSGQSAPKWALQDICLTLERGERLGLVGESGSGKSTLGRSVLRLLPEGSQVEGRLELEGESVLDLNPRALQRFRGEAVGLIFQDPMTRLNPLMTIGDHCRELLLAHQPQLSKAQVQAKIAETIDAVKIPASRLKQYAHEFSGGMRQRVAIALALLLNPKLIVADEPTTSLDVTVSAQILEELTHLCADRQMGLLLISHDLAMVGEYCDRIAVMNQGQIVEMGPVTDVFRRPQHPYSQQLLKSALHLQQSALGTGLPPMPRPLIPEPTQPALPLLRVVGVKQHYPLSQNPIVRLRSALGGPSNLVKAVDGVSFDLQPGETLGLVGESGCGKSTLSRTILRLVEPTAGQVEFLGQDLASLSKARMRRRRRQMQMIFQDPAACLNPRMTIGQSIADPLLIHNLATPAEARDRVVALLERVGLSPAASFYDRYPKQISGGQQQRVAIARALITQPKLIICDEPVSMLDATVQAQVLDLMSELKREFDLTYIFITHDLWVARFFCDRIAVMNGGQIVEIGPTQAIFNRPQHPYTQTLLGAAPMLGR
jgi:peptide/nickel transport system ATP-binding protein